MMELDKQKFNNIIKGGKFYTLRLFQLIQFSKTGQNLVRSLTYCNFGFLAEWRLIADMLRAFTPERGVRFPQGPLLSQTSLLKKSQSHKFSQFLGDSFDRPVTEKTRIYALFVQWRGNSYYAWLPPRGRRFDSDIALKTVVMERVTSWPLVANLSFKQTLRFNSACSLSRFSQFYLVQQHTWEHGATLSRWRLRVRVPSGPHMQIIVYLKQLNPELDKDLKDTGSSPANAPTALKIVSQV